MKTHTQKPALYFNGSLKAPRLGCSNCGHVWHPPGCDEAHNWKLHANYKTCPQCGQQHAPISRAKVARRVRVTLPRQIVAGFERAANELGDRLNLLPEQARAALASRIIRGA